MVSDMTSIERKGDSFIVVDIIEQDGEQKRIEHRPKGAEENQGFVDEASAQNWLRQRRSANVCRTILRACNPDDAAFGDDVAMAKALGRVMKDVAVEQDKGKRKDAQMRGTPEFWANLMFDEAAMKTAAERLVSAFKRRAEIAKDAWQNEGKTGNGVSTKEGVYKLADTFLGLPKGVIVAITDERLESGANSAE